MEQRTITVGNGALIATSEDFVNGYQAGHLAYMQQGRFTLFTDSRLIGLMMEKLESLAYTEHYSTGYVVGWIATLAAKGIERQGGERL